MKNPISRKVNGYPENVTFYRDAKGEWRWMIKANNGQIIGSSSEGYKNKSDCEANLAMVGESIQQSKVYMKLKSIDRENGFI